MTKLTRLAGSLPFAHLLGVKAGRAESSTEEEQDKPKDDKAKKAKAEGGDDTEDEAKKAKAEGDGDDKPKDDGDDKPKDDKAKKAKAEGDDDTDGEDGDDEKKEPSAAAKRERARCARIVAHGVNTGAVRQACAYAFDTNMSAHVAIETLDATAEDRKGATSLASRMSQEQNKVVGNDAANPAAEAGAAAMTVAAITAAVAKARGA